MESSDKALWIGTEGGLARFHEGRWQVFTKENSDMPVNDVYVLVESSDKALWIGTDGGLVRFHEGRWRIFTEKNSSLPDVCISALVESSDKALWIGIFCHGSRLEARRVLDPSACPEDVFMTGHEDVLETTLDDFVEHLTTTARAGRPMVTKV